MDEKGNEMVSRVEFDALTAAFVDLKREAELRGWFPEPAPSPEATVQALDSIGLFDHAAPKADAP